MDNKLNLLVLFGGKSSEHDVSCVSAAAVLDNISADKYNIIKVGITKDGRWFRFDGESHMLPGDEWLKDESLLTQAFICPDAGVQGLVQLCSGEYKITKIDVIFPVLHGKNGEDGTVQGLFSLAQIPFVGCDMISSANCMDKSVTNALADLAGIKQAKWLSYTAADIKKDLDAVISASEEKLGYPVFVKPANSGSSIGISKVNSREEFSGALENALECDNKVVLEEYIDGKEVECAVLGNDEPIAAVPGEIRPCNEFYDYDAKYIAASSGLLIPASVNQETLGKVQKLAIKAFRALGCSGFSRVDFFVTPDGEIYLNEINTIPGFTSISMYPKMFEYSGVPYSQLIDRLISLAIERGAFNR